MDGNACITIFPRDEKVGENLTNFRWNMQVPLPYPFPSRSCISREITVAGHPFKFSIHNHFSRVVQATQDGATGRMWPRAFWEDQRCPPVANPPGSVTISRQPIQSVAFFDGATDYKSPVEAFEGAGARITTCLEWLSTFLSACQRAAPYLCAWMVYPVTLFDLGAVYHEVRAWCVTHNQWHLFRDGIQLNVGKNLQRPTFFMEPPQAIEAVTPIDTTNELLAEALISLYRGMTRMTVVNSYSAVEMFANVVYAQVRGAQLVTENVPQRYAEQMAEGERKPRRQDTSFLFHSGIKTASGRSLLDERKHEYDALLKLQQLRNQVAHAGYKPSIDEARDAHKLCCEAVRWFAGVANLPVKPLLPDPAQSIPGFTVSVCGTGQGVTPGVVASVGTPYEAPTTAVFVAAQAPFTEGFQTATMETSYQSISDGNDAAKD